MNPIRFLILLLCCNTIGTYSQAPAIEWQRCYGGSMRDSGACIRPTIDGGFIVGGNSKSQDGDVTFNAGGHDFWLIKTNYSGSIEWEKTYGGSNQDILWDLEITADSGYIAVGGTKSNDGNVTGNHGGTDVWAIKLNANGNLQWQKTFGGSLSDAACSVVQTNNGEYILAGATYSTNGDLTNNHGSADIWIVKLSGAGLLQWQKTYGGSSDEDAWSIKQTPDNGYIVCGSSRSNDGDVNVNHGSADYWLIKIDSVGTLEWEKSYGGGINEYGRYVDVCVDGGYILCGFSFSSNGDLPSHYGGPGYADSWIIKTDSVGTIEWSKVYGGLGGDAAISVGETTDRDYIVMGIAGSNTNDVIGYHGNDDFWLLKLDSVGNMKWQKCLGGTAYEQGVYAQGTVDGGYIAVGVTDSYDGDVTGNHGDRDLWVVKLGPEEVSLNEYNNELNVQVFPNPADETITVSMESNGKKTTLQLSDMYGRVLKQLKTCGISIEINVRNMADGVYFVSLVSENKHYLKKLIINHL